MKPPSREAAYKVVDLSGYSRQDRDAIQADAISGGHNYGIIIVEFQVNGPNRDPVFGYYPDTEELWAEAQKEIKKEPAHASQEHEEDDDLPPVDPAGRRRPK
jgi:hypothetical protein